MAEPTPLALVDLLGRRELRIRTGILELPVETIGNESNLAVGLGVGWRDICAWKLSVTPGDRTHLGLSWEMMTQDLVSLLSDLSLPGHCVWVTNLDVLLAAIAFDPVPLRPNRSEPRAKKRRPKNYSLLTKLRHEMELPQHRSSWKAQSPKSALS